MCRCFGGRTKANVYLNHNCNHIFVSVFSISKWQIQRRATQKLHITMNNLFKSSKKSGATAWLMSCVHAMESNEMPEIILLVVSNFTQRFMLFDS